MRAVTLLLALAITVPSAAVSQTILADIHIGRGPVQGRIVIGHPSYYYPAPVVVTRYPEHRHSCHPIVVRHAPHGIGRGYHRAVLWYHPASGRYYDHRHSDFHGLRQVSAWEREGQHGYDD